MGTGRRPTPDPPDGATDRLRVLRQAAR
jgi:hypothetical protein